MELLGDVLDQSEVFKIVLNNGFLALFVVWVLFKGEPRYREMIEKLSSEHRQAMETVVRSHEAEIAAMHKECREERQEMLKAIAREGELNRASRHDLAASMQRAIAEIYAGRARDQKRTKGGSGEHRPLPESE